MGGIFVLAAIRTITALQRPRTTSLPGYGLGGVARRLGSRRRCANGLLPCSPENLDPTDNRDDSAECNQRPADERKQRSNEADDESNDNPNDAASHLLNSRSYLQQTSITDHARNQS